MTKFAYDYLDYLFCILNADGVIHEREAEFFADILNNLGMQDKLVDHYNQILLGRALFPILSDTTTRIVENRKSSEIAYIVRDAFLLAGIDGEVHEAELTVIRNLLKKLGLSDDIILSIEDWGYDYINHTNLGLELFKGVGLFEKPVDNEGNKTRITLKNPRHNCMNQTQ